MANDLALRELTVADEAAVSDLTQQLGYKLGMDEAVARLSALLGTSGHYLIGASLGADLIGFLHCFDRPSIEKGRALVVQSLVIDASVRRSGAGRALMAEAERIAGRLGCPAVTLSSNVARDDAHAFYERLGYRTYATSKFFIKEI